MERGRRNRLGDEMKRFTWSQGLYQAAMCVTLKYITHPCRSRWGSLPGGLQWRVQGRVTYEREREREMKWWEQQRWVSNVSSLVLWWGGRSEVWVIDTLRIDLINACARIHQQAVMDAIFRGLKVYEAYIFTENKFMTTITICCTTLIRYERQKWLKSCFKNDPTFLAFFS